MLDCDWSSDVCSSDLHSGLNDDAATCEIVLAGAQKAPKFILPVGGRIFADKLKGLPDELRLPFPEIVIEYQANVGGEGAVEVVFGDTHVSAPKRIVYAIQVDDGVKVYSLCLMRTDDIPGGLWAMQPYFAVCYRPVCDENVFDVPEWTDGILQARDKNAAVLDRIACSHHPTGSYASKVLGPAWRRNAYYDLLDEVNSVLELIEALSCSNVSHEAIPVRKLNKGAARRGALPFDEYRTLVVRNAGSGHVGAGHSGLHRSPREHLRRGHIRRLADGRKVWVQSCVVNAGIGGNVTTVRDMRRAA
jgi:hypothetical protein